MLLAEELLLLFLDDETGRIGNWDDKTIDIALGAALMAELVIVGVVELSEPAGFLQPSRVRVRQTDDPAELILQDAAWLIGAKEHKVSSAISKLRRGVRVRLFTQLVERGVVEHHVERHAVVRRRSTWQIIDSSHKNRLRESIAQALFDGGELNQREAVLVRLLAKSSFVHLAFPAGAANESFVQRGIKNLQLLKDAESMTDRTWTPPELEHVFTACERLVPTPD